MRRQHTLYLLALSFALGAAFNVPGQEPALTKIDFPGAASTAAWGVNSYRDVVGTYLSADASGHAFLLSGQVFTTINFPGAALTGVYGINDRGDIVGLYAITASGPHHGFLLDKDGKFSTVDFPGATVSEAAGINNRGEIAGLYTLPDNTTHGFVLSNGQFRNVDFPGAATSFGNGIGNSGGFVGNYTTGGVTHGYLVNHGILSSVDVPGAALTGAYGADSRDRVVGRYRDAAGVTHGYKLSEGKFTTIDIPGATLTSSAAINDYGDIVGRYVVAGVNHGFLLSQPPGKYDLTDLGTLPGGKFSQATLVNDNGLLTGLADLPDGSQHGVIWQAGQIVDIGKPGLGGPNSGVFGVNQRGQALVQAESSEIDPNRENFCGYGTGLKCLPALWQAGVMTPLPLAGGNNGTVGIINKRGQAAGMAENSTRDPECPTGVSFSGTGPQVLDFEAVIWGPRPGEIHVLPPLRGDSVGMALAINDNGQAVGASGRCANTVLPPIAFGPHAVMWEKDGTVHDLGSLGGTLDATMGLGNVGLSINNSGQVVGASVVRGKEASHGFLWSKETGIRDLGTLPGDGSSFSGAINDRGQVVGASFDEEGNPRGYLWQRGVMTDLNTLIPADSPLFVLMASSINSHGEIAGFGATETGEVHAFLATPRRTTEAGQSLLPAARLGMVADGRDAFPENVRTLVRQRLSFSRFGTRHLGPR